MAKLVVDGIRLPEFKRNTERRFVINEKVAAANRVAKLAMMHEYDEASLKEPEVVTVIVQPREDTA